MDDFLRNFFVKMGLSRTCEAFEAEWYELKATGRLEGSSLVPDVYLRNAVSKKTYCKQSSGSIHVVQTRHIKNAWLGSTHASMQNCQGSKQSLLGKTRKLHPMTLSRIWKLSCAVTAPYHPVQGSGCALNTSTAGFDVHFCDCPTQELEEEIGNIRRELNEARAIAGKASATWDKFRKERDFHRMHHKRVAQEKNKLITDIKRLKVCSAWCILLGGWC